MTIRKISGATSSIISKAQLVVGTPGIIKASVTRGQLLATVQTEIDIIKSALISPRTIDRLLYDDEGSSRFLREFVLVGESLGLGQFKSVNDFVVMLDVLDLARLALGISPDDVLDPTQDRLLFAVNKSLADSFNATEVVAKTVATALYDTLLPFNDDTLILQGKGFNDSLNAADQNLIFDYGFTYRDAFDTIDVKSLSPNKAAADVFLVSDPDRVNFQIGKLFADGFASLDLANIFDGISYNASIVRSDESTIYEYLAFAITNYRRFTDDLLIGDPISLGMQIPRSELLLTSDLSNLNIAKNNFDSLISADQSKFSIANQYTDQFDPNDRTSLNYDLLLINRDPLLVSISDASQRQAGLGRVELVTAEDNGKYFNIAKAFADAFTPISLAAVADGAVFLFNYYTNDAVTMTDLLLNFVIGAQRNFADDISETDAQTLAIDKGLLDTQDVAESRALALAKIADPDYQQVVEAKYLQLDLSRVDGQDIFDVGTALFTFKDIFNSTAVLEKTEFIVVKALTDNTDAIEYLARRFDAVRGERDGFVETFLTNERSSLEPGKFNYEELLYQDVFSRIIVGGRRPEDVLESQDAIFKLEQRRPAHAIVAADLGYVFNIVKGFNDPVNMLDLTGTFDGSKYSISMDKTEVQPVYEYYRPKWRIRRRGRDGFLEEVTVIDTFSIDRLQETNPLDNYVYTHGDNGFRYTPSGGQHYYNGVNGELFLLGVAPEWTIFDISLAKFEDLPTPDDFRRVVTFIRNPHHNDLIGGGSDGFANDQPMTDVSANSPYPARFFSTNIPSPTKSDTSVTAVVVGGTSSIATNYFMWSNFQSGIANSIIGDSGYITYYGEDPANPNLGPDSTTSAARLTSTGGTTRVGIELTSNATTYGNIFGGTNNGSVTLLNIQPGKEYYFNLKVKSNIGGNVIVRLYADVNGGTVNWTAFTSTYTVTNSAWSDLRLAFTPLTSTGIRVAVGNWVSGGSILVASAAISEIATAPYVRTNGWQIGQNPRNIDPAENVAYDFGLDAKAGASYSVINKTTDFVLGTAKKIINPVLQNSSLTVSYQPKDRDFVGVYDNSMNYVYAAARPTNDFVTLGAGDNYGFRYQSSENTSETVKFTVTKSRFDFDVPGTTGALVVMGRGTSSVVYPERRSGDSLDNPAFAFRLDAKQTILTTVSSTTVQARDRDRIFVGQQSWQGNAGGFRNAGDSQERIVFLLSKDNSGRDSIAVGLSSTATGIRTQPTESSLENTRFTLVKAPGLQGAYDTSVVTVGNWQTTGDRTISSSELVSFTITKSRFDKDVAGTTGAVVTAGRNSSVASVAYPERRSGDKLDNAAFDFFKTAFAGSSVTWTVQLNTIDPSPDIEFQASSVTITYGPKDVDRIGMLDRFNLFYTVGRIFDLDFITIGTDTGFRYQPTESSLEWTRFFFIKGLSDTVPMLDLTGIFDGLNSYVSIFKTESSTILDNSRFSPYPARFMTKDIGIGNHNGTADIFYIGVSSTATGIRTQPTESSLENTKFTIVKAPGLQGAYDTSVVTVGNWQTAGDRTISTSELVTFNVAKLALQGVDYSWTFGTTTSRTTAARGDFAYAGDPSFAGRSRLSNSAFERIGFDYIKTARAGSSVTWSISVNTIDANPDVEFQQSSITLSYGPSDTDAIGSLDRFFLTLATRRIFDLDSIIIGTDTGFRYQPSESSLENTKFTITKSRFDKDVAGTTGALVVMGRGTSSVAYPERRSGDSLDNPAFVFSLDAKVNSSSTFSYSVSGVTVLGRDRDRLFVGQQSWQGNVLGFRNSGDGQERILFLLSKTADAIIPASVSLAGDTGFRYQPTESTLENTKFTITKRPGQQGAYDTSVVTVGNWQNGLDGRAVSSSELVTFNITKSRFDKDVAGTTGALVVMGRGTSSVAYPERRSGDKLDNPAFDFSLTAKRSVAGTLLLNTIDPVPDIEFQASSVAIAVNAWDLDAVGTLDRFNLFYQITRTFDQDFITIGTDTGFRYQPTESSLEWTRFFFNKGLADIVPMLDLTGIFDGLNSNVTIQKQERTIIGFGSSTGVKVAGSLLEQIPFSFFKTADTVIPASVSLAGDTGFRYQPDESSLENTYFTIVKRPGQQGAYDTSVVTVGNWQTSGDRTISTSELVTFNVAKLALQGTDNTWSGYINNSSFAATAGARGERIYVGDPLQGVYPLRRSGAQAENVGFNFFKTAKAGSSVTWSINVNTIDRDPDFEWNASSVTLTYGPSDLDAIGMSDRWWMAFGVSRSPIDSITIGSGVDDRLFYTTEKTTFAVFKTRFDKDVPGTTGAIVTLLDDLTIFPGRNFFESLTISDNSRFSPYPAKDFFKTTGIGGAGSSNTIVIIGSGVDSRLGFTTEKAAFAITKSRFDFDVPGTTGAVVTVGWGDAVERPRTGITYGGFFGDTISGEATTFNITKLAEQGVDNIWSGYINSSSFSTTAADNGERVYVGDPFRGVYPLRRSGAQNENVSINYDKTAKIGRVQSTILQFIDGNNGYVSGLTTSFNTSDTDIVGLFSGIIDVRTFVRNPWINDYDGIPGALDAYITPDERNYKLLSKRIYRDDGSMGTDNVVVGTALVGRNSSNLLTYSEQITTSNGAWIVTNGSINITTDDTTYTNPLGDATGVTRLSPAANNRYIGQEVTSNVVAGMPHSFSIWARTSGATSGVGLYADTNGGAISFDAGSAFSFTGTWTRYTISFVPTTTTGVRVFIGNASVWDSNEPIWVWGAQLSQTTTSIAYVATTSAPVLDIVPDHYAGDELENVNLLLDLRAKRGAAGTLLLNTIDPNPDVEWQQSSVEVTVTAADLDAVGTLDYFSIYYMLYRQFDEYLTIGSGIDSRLGYDTEKLAFVFTKLLGQFGDNEAPILDLAGVFDGNIFNAILSKADTQIVGSGQTSQTFPARTKSGASEIVGFDFYKTTGIGGAGSSNTVVTVGRSTDGRLGSEVEKAYFTVSATLGNARDTSVQTQAVAGSGVDDRLGYANEKTFFTVSKARFDRDVAGTTGALVVMGRGASSATYPERRSGDQLDTAAFLYGMRANRGTTGTVTLKLIDPTDGNGFNSSAAVSYQPYDYDVVGSIDFMSAIAATGRIIQDLITIGTDNGFRYQASQNTSETVKFTIGKRANEYDGSTSYVTMGWGDLVERPRTGITYGGFFGDTISGEAITFNITKRAKEYNGTTANIILGRGLTSVAYPERRSGDSLDNPAFDFAKTAQFLGTNVVREFSSPVPEQTGVTVVAVRSDSTIDPVFVGSQGYYPEADVLANSSTTSIWVQQTQQSGYTQGTTYNFSIYMRQPVAASNSMTFDIGYTSLAVITTTTSFTVSNSWSRYNFNFVAPRSSLTVRIRTTNTTRRDSLEIFGAQIVAGTSPQTYVKTTTAGSAANLILQSEDFNDATWAKSSNTIVYANMSRVDILGAGVDWARPGDAMEELYYTVGKKADSDGAGSSLSFVVAGAGDNYGFRYQASENTSETVKFTITKSRFDKDVAGTTGAIVTVGGNRSLRYQPSESDLENVYFDFDLTAKRGVAGNVTLNTIDSNPDIEFRVSSVTISRGSWQPDEVGMLDAFNLFYQITRVFDTDFVTIGTDNGFRNQNSAETVKFLMTKLLGQDDGTTMLDLTEVFDGLVYNTTMLKREALTLGRGTTTATFPERRSGDSLDNPAFDFSLDAKFTRFNTSVTYTVSGTTVRASDRDRLFVGQQSWQGNDGGFRNAGDGQERIIFNTAKVADADGVGSSTAYVVMGAGDEYGFRYQASENTSETVKFTVTKARFDFDVPGTTGAIVTLGRESTSQAYPERRSGDSLDNPAFLFGMTANRGVSSTVTIKTIDPPSGDAGQSSVSVLYWPNDYDVVGAVDFMFVQMIGTGRSFIDTILIGTDTGFRYQPSESSLESTKFTIGKRATEYDGGTSFVTIGGDTGFRYQTSESELENTYFVITKSRFDKDVAGTTGALVVMGRNNTSQTYPERRSGDSLDNPAFDYIKPAQYNGLVTGLAQRWVSPFANTSAVAPAFRHSDLGDTLYIGSQGYKRAADILSVSSNATNVVFSQVRNNGGFVSGTTYTFSIYLRRPDYTAQTGMFLQAGTTSLTINFATSVNVTTTWTRHSLTFVAPRTSITVTVNTSGAPTGADDVEVFGAQIVAGTSPGTYTRTTTTTSAANLLLHSEDFNNAAWVKNSGVLVYNKYAPAPTEFWSSYDWARPGDSQEEMYYTIGKQADSDGQGSSLSFVTMGAGDNYGFRYQSSENTSETVKFTVSKARFDKDVAGTTGAIVVLGRESTSQTYPERRSGDSLDNPAFDFYKTAKRSVAGTVTLNTIDPNPDVEYQQSSVTVSRTGAQLDEVGTLDFFNLYYVINRFNTETITIGTDTGFRYQSSENTSETVKFLMTKLLGQDDGTVMLDLTEVFDGLVYNTTMLKREALTVGRGTTTATFPERRSGQTEEIAQFDFSLDAKASLTYTVSGVTVTARDRDRLFVGQQSWQGNTLGKRNSGDSQERILFTVAKSADQDGAGSSVSFVVAGAGDDYGFRYQASENTSETVKFTITKSRFDQDVPGTTGAIVTMDTNDADLLFSLDAKQGSSTTTTLSSTTVRARDRDRVFLGQQLWQGNQGKRVSGDALESFVINLYKPFTETSTTILDRTALYGQKGGISDDLTMLGEGVEFMNLNFFSPKVDSTEITDLLVINVVFPVRAFDYPGDLDLNGNINTVASNGNLRMTDYADIDYFEDDFVGEKRSFT